MIDTTRSTATTDRMLRSYREQRPVTHSDPFSPLLHCRVDPHQLQLLVLCKCTNTTKYTLPCVCVLAFSQSFFKGLATQLVTPLNPSDDAKLDHSSGTPDSMAIYPKPGQTLLYTTYDR